MTTFSLQCLDESATFLFRHPRLALPRSPLASRRGVFRDRQKRRRKRRKWHFSRIIMIMIIAQVHSDRSHMRICRKKQSLLVRLLFQLYVPKPVLRLVSCDDDGNDDAFDGTVRSTSSISWLAAVIAGIMLLLPALSRQERGKLLVLKRWDRWKQLTWSRM